MTWLDGLPIRRRILLLSAVAAVVAIGIGMLVFGLVLRSALDQSARATAKAQADRVAVIVSASDKPLSRVLDDVAAQGALLQVLSSDGRVLVSRDPQAAEPLLDVRDGQTSAERADLPGETGEPYAISATASTLPGGVQGYVVAAVPMAHVDASTRLALLLLAVGAALVMVMFLLFIGRAVRSSLRSVERIRGEVAAIRHAGGGARIAVPQTGDEIARLAATMNDMLQRLDHADAAQRQFVSDASHELRSPLTTLRIGLETLPALPDEERQKRGALLLAETVRIQRLVDDLLTLAKSEDPTFRLTTGEVDLDEVVTAEAGRLRAAGGVPVKAWVEPVRIRGDELRLTQAVRNLCDNAARHARSAVALRLERQGSEAVITVDNDGPVIPADQRDTVFERFTRLDESRSRDVAGSGLGLAITRRLVEAHGGSVTAGETDAGWCRFEIRLPDADQA